MEKFDHNGRIGNSNLRYTDRPHAATSNSNSYRSSSTNAEDSAPTIYQQTPPYKQEKVTQTPTENSQERTDQQQTHFVKPQEKQMSGASTTSTKSYTRTRTTKSSATEDNRRTTKPQSKSNTSLNIIRRTNFDHHHNRSTTQQHKTPTGRRFYLNSWHKYKQSLSSLHDSPRLTPRIMIIQESTDSSYHSS